MFQTKKDLADVMSIFGYCHEDNTYLLIKDCDSDLWIPSMAILGYCSWKKYAADLTRDVFTSDIGNEKLLKLKKIWTQERDLYHLIFLASVTKEQKAKARLQPNWEEMHWLTCSDIFKAKHLLRSAEILEYIQLSQARKIPRELITLKGEVNPMGPLTEITENDLLLIGDNFLSEKHQHLIENSGFGVEKQCAVYEEFFFITYPCIYMSFNAFQKFLLKYDWKEDHKTLFKVADIWERDFLTFQDFLYLVISLEPSTPHSGAIAEIRCEYIFGYYDKDQNGKLDIEEFKHFLHDIHHIRNSGVCLTTLPQEIDEISKSVGMKFGTSMTIEEFLSHVKEAKIRGTSLLLRFSKSILNQEKEEIKKPLRRNVRRKSSIRTVERRGKEGLKMPDYEMCSHAVELNKRGMLRDINEVKSLKDAMSSSYAENLTLLPDIIRPTADLIDIDTKVNELLLALKYFTSEIKETDNRKHCICPKDSFSWGPADLEIIGTTLLLLCGLVKELLTNEPRLLKIESPVYVLGDLHGSYRDLNSFEKCFWELGLSLTPAKLLFLGDFVDRGPNSLEVIMYLFATKVQNPNKIFFVRGNHELRDVQKLFSFPEECIAQFGETLGAKVWAAVNGVFDVMPLAAVIDEKVFCCHGGIPPPWLCPVISVINEIPCPLTDCEKQSPLAWNLMWNDPVKSSSSCKLSEIEIELLVREGFAANRKRGTANVFSKLALERFLKVNSLSQVIRAHEVKKAGFQVHQTGALLTVFSSSAYCGGNNKSATILAAHNVLRMFMIDTVN